MTPENPSGARILDPTSSDEDARFLAETYRDATIDHLDTWSTQLAALERASPADEELHREQPRWAYFPWRRAVVKILGPRSFRRLRLDRNRNLITLDEQDHLASLRIGVVGLSSGHVIAHTLALQGLCGELRLADFDDLELSNLNRVPGGVFDLGINKAVVAARRIAELDPYLIVDTLPSGVTTAGMEAFLAGLHVVVEECDSLDVKALVRREARARRVPVLMATSDRGLVDVERFDLEPDRPIFHGLLGDFDTEELTGLTGPEKIPYVMRLIEAAGLSVRSAASLLEVGYTLTTWPQLAGDVTLGAGALAEAVRRIGLGEPLGSGRVRLDVRLALDDIEAPPVTELDRVTDVAPDRALPLDLIGSVVAAANLAPSGGNVQPWTIESDSDSVTVRLVPERTSTIDVGLRGSAVAVGAAVFNAQVAAAANGAVGRVTYAENATDSPLSARLHLTAGTDTVRANQYPAMLRRETNRRPGERRLELTIDVRDALVDAARREGARLSVVTDPEVVDQIAHVLSAADRVRYLTPTLHEDMASELRWPGDDDPDTGIDVRSLELGNGGLLALEILRRPQVMAELAAWDGGTVLGADTGARVRASSALAVVCVEGHGLTDYARGGSAVESVWITAQERGLSVQPISPAFLYARDDDELNAMSPRHASTLTDLRTRFQVLTEAGDDTPVLLLRLAVAKAPSVRSRRRRVHATTPLR